MLVQLSKAATYLSRPRNGGLMVTIVSLNYTTDLSQRREHERESICSQINNC